MALEVVQGSLRNRVGALGLAEVLSGALSEGTLYLGYPVLSTADDQIEIDGLLVSENHGLAAFIISEEQPGPELPWEYLIEQQDRLFTILESNLKKHDALRIGRKLIVNIATATILSRPVPPPQEATEAVFLSTEEVVDWVRGLPKVDPLELRAVQAALQKVTTIKPRKRRTLAKTSESRGSKLKIFEKEIANLDRWQRAAAIESPEGPQRIRGLAGSGKTIVLALKAAYLHAVNPDWVIGVTFHSRSLYQQFNDLITRFTFEHTSDDFDPEKLRILHSWGSSQRAGMYSVMAEHIGQIPKDFNTAQATYGREGAFQGVCRELLEVATHRDFEPLFDAVLIDEAQDLPAEFYRLVYLFTRDPKRIVWAYDELQKLSEQDMPNIEEMFGTGPNNEPLVSIANPEDGARRDVVLPVCYRNTPWALTTAHAVGLGIYRADGLIQHFDEPSLWQDVGYSVERGILEHGEHVRLKRATDRSPEYFYGHLDAQDSVAIQGFVNAKEQDIWVAEQISVNLGKDELEHDDILVVLPDPRSAKTRGSQIRSLLQSAGIAAHIVGVGSSSDEVFSKGSVAITHIHRAKGNEAPMVYVLDAQYATVPYNELTRRNILFTAITRSRAWVRILGWGREFSQLLSELDKVQSNSFTLDFRIPTDRELAEMRRIHRERSQHEVQSIQTAARSADTFLTMLERGELDLEDLPPAIRTRLVRTIKKQMQGGDEYESGTQ